jgi:hypothetical protein
MSLKRDGGKGRCVNCGGCHPVEECCVPRIISDWYRVPAESESTE